MNGTGGLYGGGWISHTKVWGFPLLLGPEPDRLAGAADPIPRAAAVNLNRLYS